MITLWTLLLWNVCMEITGSGESVSSTVSGVASSPPPPPSISQITNYSGARRLLVTSALIVFTSLPAIATFFLSQCKHWQRQPPHSSAPHLTYQKPTSADSCYQEQNYHQWSMSTQYEFWVLEQIRYLCYVYIVCTGWWWWLALHYNSPPPISSKAYHLINMVTLSSSNWI